MRRDRISFPTRRPGGAALLAALLACAGPCAAAGCVPLPNAPILSVVSLLIVTTTVLMGGCVLRHHQTLRLPSFVLLRLCGKDRRRIPIPVLALIALAIVEIWLSELGYGALHGPGRVDEFLDTVYFSAVIYTTLGPGDLVPSGAIRFLVGAEALVGRTPISWSAAFTFLETDRFWCDRTERRHRAAYGTGHGRDRGD